jgi:hypothetical protein
MNPGLDYAPLEANSGGRFDGVLNSFQLHFDCRLPTVQRAVKKNAAMGSI